MAIVLLTISDSYIFQTFFTVSKWSIAISPSAFRPDCLQMFALVIFFGLFHAIVFLPLAMSLVGPMPDAALAEGDGGKRDADLNGVLSAREVTKL